MNNNTSPFYVHRIDYSSGDASYQRKIRPETLTMVGTKDDTTYHLVSVLNSREERANLDSSVLEGLSPISHYDELIKNIVVDGSKLQSDQDIANVQRLVELFKKPDFPKAIQKTSKDISVLGIKENNGGKVTFAVNGRVDTGLTPMNISAITVKPNGIEVIKRHETGEHALQHIVPPETAKRVLKDVRFVPNTPENSQQTKTLQENVSAFLKNTDSR